MKRWMKKGLTVFLTFAMLAGLCVPAAAAEDIPDQEQETAAVLEETVPVTGISLEEESLAMVPGETRTLPAVHVFPENAEEALLSWAVSEGSCVQLSDGMVTAAESGVSVLTVSERNSGLSLSCRVTVSQTAVPGTETAGSGQNETVSETADGGEASGFAVLAAKQPVDNSTDFPDGEYVPEEFEFLGGTGKATVSCDKVIVSGGKATAVFATNSSSFTHYCMEKPSGSNEDISLYDPATDTCGVNTYPLSGKQAVVPVILNQTTDFSARTTAMTDPHWISYTYKITLSKPEGETVSLKAVDAQSGDQVSGAEFSVTDGSGAAAAVSGGQFFRKKGVTYTVTASASGYQDGSLTTADGDGTSLSVSMTPQTFTVSFAAKDSKTKETVDAAITVNQDGGGSVSLTDGSAVLTYGRSYTASAKANHYEDAEKTFTAKQAETIQLLMQAKTCTVRFKVKDALTGQEIDGAKLTVEGTEGEITPEADGSYVLRQGQSYTAEAAADGYLIGKKSCQPTGSMTIPLELKPSSVEYDDNGEPVLYALSVRVVDDAGTEITPSCTVTVADKEGKTVQKANGTYPLVNSTVYTVRAEADGYTEASKTVSLTSAQEVTLTLSRKDCTVTVQAVDAETSGTVSKAKITAKDIQGKPVAGTDDTHWSVKYGTVLAFTAEAEGYDAEPAALAVRGDQTVQLKLTRKNWVVTIQAVDSATSASIPSAAITVTAADGSAVNPSDGVYLLKHGSVYGVKASAEGYSSEAEVLTAAKNQLLQIPLEKKSSGSGDSGSGSSQTDGKVVKNGTYNVNYKDADNKMFNVTKVVLHSSNGKYSADITLHGDGYDYVYVGDGKQAAAANGTGWVFGEKNADGTRTYKGVIVPELNKPFLLASRSEKYANDPAMASQAWRDTDHLITIYSQDVNGNALPMVDGTRDYSGANTNSGTGGTDGGRDNLNGNTSGNQSSGSGSSYSATTGGSTSEVNANTGLTDGTYKPDSFEWNGGTGKVTITCDAITVKGGKTYATITFHSRSGSNFQYVKAGGQKVTDVVRGATTSTFTIPVELNKNNTILAMTTAMSQPHEIEYTIYVGLDAAKAAAVSTAASGAGTVVGSDGTTRNTIAVDAQYLRLDTDVPEIAGLTFDHEEEVVYSSLFRIYHYKDGYSLIEVDVTAGTGLDPVLAAEELEEDKANGTGFFAPETEAEAEEAAAEEAAEEDEAISDETITEQKTALYKNNVIKYLVVPANGTVPAGIDRKTILIQQPADRSAVTSANAVSMLDDLALTDKITAVGLAENEVSVESVRAGMQAEDGDDPAILPVGSYKKLDYKALIMHKPALIIEDSAILPKGVSDGESAADQAEDGRTARKMQMDKAREEAEAFYTIGSRSVQMQTALLVDRSTDEGNELARAEWYKLYGTIFGVATQAETVYQTVVKGASDADKQAAETAAKKRTEETLEAVKKIAELTGETAALPNTDSVPQDTAAAAQTGASQTTETAAQNAASAEAA